MKTKRIPMSVLAALSLVVRGIMRKMGARSFADLVCMAMKLQILEQDLGRPKISACSMAEHTHGESRRLLNCRGGFASKIATFAARRARRPARRQQCGFSSSSTSACRRRHTKMDRAGRPACEWGAARADAMHRSTNGRLNGTWRSPETDHVDSVSWTRHRGLVLKRRHLPVAMLCRSK